MNRARAIIRMTFRFDMPECYAATSVARSNCRNVSITLIDPMIGVLSAGDSCLDRHKQKSRPFGRLFEIQTPYGITPAGGCGAAPCVVAAAASFKIR